MDLASPGIVATKCRPRRQRRVLTGLCFLFFLPGWFYAGYRMVKLGGIPTTQVERDAYPATQLPIYPALEFLNRSRGSHYSVYGLFAENMIYFAQGRYLGDWNGPAAYRFLIEGLSDSCVLEHRLRDFGAGYLLVSAASFPRAVIQDDCFHRHFRAVFADRGARVFALDNAP